MSINSLNTSASKAGSNTLSNENFQFLSHFLKKHSGLSITQDKAYLVETRLNVIAKENNYANLNELVNALKGFGAKKLQDNVAEAMATHETLFFRDKKPFDQFRDEIMPDLMTKKANDKRINILSAACSSGQEPYSLAITLAEMKDKLTGWNVNITGIDFSNPIIEQAKLGVYSQFEVQRGLPVQLLMKYFQQNGTKWQVKQNIKSMIKFQQFNLLDNLRPLGMFDIIYCRNALFYFDLADKTKIINGFADILNKGGYFGLGTAETVIGISDRFEPVKGQRGLYTHA